MNHEEARKIMGGNFLGAEEMAKCFNVILTKEDLARISEIPFSEKILQECKNDHILFLGLDKKDDKPLTIERMVEMFPDKFSWSKGAWYTKGKIAEETPEFKWYLVSRNKIVGSEKHVEKAVVFIYSLLLAGLNSCWVQKWERTVCSDIHVSNGDFLVEVVKFTPRTDGIIRIDYNFISPKELERKMAISSIRDIFLVQNLEY